MKQLRRRQPNSSAQRGVSLIEVLVVLAILTLGILVIVELFPRGFFSIESAGVTAQADGLGQELIQEQSQNSAGLPDAILPGTLTTAQVTDANYDPDDPNLLNNARVISNETISVPSPTAASPQPVYVVNYGPIKMTGSVSNSIIVNGTNWQALSGDSTTESGVAPIYPQNTIFPGQPQFLVDLAKGEIAVPYSQSYSQTITMKVVGNDGMTYTLLPTLPHSGSSSTTDPGQMGTYMADSSAYYNGNWFDPKDPTLAYDTVSTKPPIPWKSVTLYRAFAPKTVSTFTTDPYEFALVNGNVGINGDMNLGAIAFNPLAAKGNGYSPLKAQISYQAYDWQIIHEDRDIPALTSGGQYIARLTLKRLKSDGQSYPDSDKNGTVNNATYAGIFGSKQDVVVLDLDTGVPVAASGVVNEDQSGTSVSAISVGHSVGRLVVPYAAFSGAAHRIRVFYQVIGDWTAAVQKAPAYYEEDPNITTGANPSLVPGHYTFDPSQGQAIVYLPQCDYGKTVEIDGTYIDKNGNTQSFSDTAAVGVVSPGGVTYYGIQLTDSHLANPLVNLPSGPVQVNFTAVRGLSTRAVVAWKENYHWKVHTVDTVLTRAQ